MRESLVACGALVAAALAVAAPATAPGALVGTGTFTFHGCSPDTIVLAGSETAPGLWVFQLQTPGANECLAAYSDTYAGAWSPAGGCVPGFTFELCLTNPTPAPGPGGLAGTRYDFTVCHGMPVHCGVGTVTFAGAVS